MNLLSNIKITRVANAAAAGTSAVNGSTIDMQGFDGVIFVAAVGTLTASQVTSLKAQEGDTASPTADLAGSLVGPLADADSNKLLVLDIYRPLKRYMRAVLNRATANAVVDGIWAIQYCGEKAPTTHDATTVAATKLKVSPVAGTA